MCIRDSNTIEYFVCEWNEYDLSWANYLENVIGDKDPSVANAKSIRGRIYSDWLKLGLKEEPSVCNNCVHASASAFEAMVERLRWVQGSLVFTDLFGSRLIESRVASQTIRAWSSNPIIKDRYLFDQMYRKGADECLALANKLMEERILSQPTMSLSRKPVASVKKLASLKQIGNLPSTLASPDDKHFEANPVVVTSTSTKQGVFEKRHGTIESAFLLLKPYVNNDKVIRMVNDVCDYYSVRIVKRGSVSCKDMIDKNLIDKTYMQLMEKATKDSALSLALFPEEVQQFNTTFEDNWHNCMKLGQVLNIQEACSLFKCNDDELYERWSTAVSHIKIRQGLHIAKIEAPETFKSIKEPDEPQNKYARKKVKAIEPSYIYIINGFYTTMKNAMIKDNKPIEYFVVEWDADAMSFTDFITKIIGNSDPVRASSFSIRGKLYQEWLQLGLSNATTYRDNGIYCSTSSLKGMVDRLMWVKGSIMFTDIFGARLLKARVQSSLINKYMSNPATQGKYLFQILDRKNSDDTLELLKTLDIK